MLQNYGCVNARIMPDRVQFAYETTKLYPIRCKMKKNIIFAVNRAYRQHLGIKNKRFYFALRSVCTTFAPDRV